MTGPVVGPSRDDNVGERFMSLFAQAAASKAATTTAPKSKKKATRWEVGNKDHEQLNKALDQLVELNNQKKALEAKMDIPKRLLSQYAQQKYIDAYADTGVPPETPMQIVNENGAKATYVVQDRSSNYKVKEEQIDALTQMLGEDGAADMICTKTTYAFTEEAMTNPEVMQIIEKHLGAAVEELVGKGLANDVLDVLDPQTRTTFKPGVLGRLGLISGRNTTKLGQVLKALGGAAVRYIKV